jgi:hypothetical protein
VHYGPDDQIYKGVMPGSGWETWNDVAVWLGSASLKVLVDVMDDFSTTNFDI